MLKVTYLTDPEDVASEVEVDNVMCIDIPRIDDRQSRGAANGNVNLPGSPQAPCIRLNANNCGAGQLGGGVYIPIGSIVKIEAVA